MMRSEWPGNNRFLTQISQTLYGPWSAFSLAFLYTLRALKKLLASESRRNLGRATRWRDHYVAACLASGLVSMHQGKRKEDGVETHGPAPRLQQEILKHVFVCSYLFLLEKRKKSSWSEGESKESLWRRRRVGCAQTTPRKYFWRCAQVNPSPFSKKHCNPICCMSDPCIEAQVALCINQNFKRLFPTNEIFKRNDYHEFQIIFWFLIRLNSFKVII